MKNLKKWAFVLLSASLGVGAMAQHRVEPDIYKRADLSAVNYWVDSVCRTMSLDDKIGQTITVITTGENTAANKQKLTNFVKNQRVGGIIFLKGTPQEQAAITNACQQAADVPLMISIDGEWGLSMRLENTTRFPKNMMIGAIQDDSLAYYYGLEVARQCHEMGIHVNFAPDLDVNSNPDNPVIGIRSYGENPKRVAELGIMYSRGLEAGGVMSVAKHFPGHGDTSTDSHKELPVITHDRKRLEKIELAPFKEYIKAGLSGMMSGHLNVPALDKSGLPSSLSRPIVTDLLQKELGFSGLVFTDGLAMKGVSDQPNMSEKALLAGNDILLGPISPVKEFNALKAAVQNGTISEEFIEAKCKKILAYKYILGVNRFNRVETNNLLNRLNTSYAEWLSRKMNEKAITLVKNDHSLIPFEHLDNAKIAAVSIGAPSKNPFHETLKSYGDVKCFSVTDGAGLASLKTTLAKYNTIIVSIHANKAYNSDAIQSVIAGKKSTLVFFTVPYRMTSMKGAVDNADAVVVGYENTDFAQEYAAQAIFGGNEISGRLPVSVKGLFDVGDGHDTKKIRLSYNLPEEVGVPAYKLNGIESIVREGLDAQAYPGCQVLIAKDGVVIYNHSFGYFDYTKKREVENSDLYDIASMTKASATIPALMKLYDEKKLALQTPISRYVSALKGTDKSDITIREALFHETGLTSFIPYYMPAIDQTTYIGRLFSAKRTDVFNAKFDNSTWARTDYRFKSNLISPVRKDGFTLQIADDLYANVAYPDTIIQAIADSKLRANKNYLYSCLNFMLLKEVVETIADTDLNTYLQDNIYSKLGSYTTTYNPLTRFDRSEIAPTERDNFLRKQLLQGYVHDEGAAFMGGISGNAGLFSNANDLAKVYQMWLNGGVYGGERILSKETCRVFTTTKSPRSRRGLGFDKPDIRNNKLSPCSPQTPVSVYGHTGFTGTCFWVDPDNNLIYIFLSNRVYGNRSNKKLMSMNIRSRIQEEIYNALR